MYAKIYFFPQPYSKLEQKQELEKVDRKQKTKMQFIKKKLLETISCLLI